MRKGKGHWPLANLKQDDEAHDFENSIEFGVWFHKWYIYRDEKFHQGCGELVIRPSTILTCLLKRRRLHQDTGWSRTVHLFSFWSVASFGTTWSWSDILMCCAADFVNVKSSCLREHTYNTIRCEKIQQIEHHVDAITATLLFHTVSLQGVGLTKWCSALLKSNLLNTTSCQVQWGKVEQLAIQNMYFDWCRPQWHMSRALFLSLFSVTFINTVWSNLKFSLRKMWRASSAGVLCCFLLVTLYQNLSLACMAMIVWIY